jgi:hypothetical protein
MLQGTRHAEFVAIDGLLRHHAGDVTAAAFPEYVAPPLYCFAGDSNAAALAAAQPARAKWHRCPTDLFVQV